MIATEQLIGFALPQPQPQQQHITHLQLAPLDTPAGLHHHQQQQYASYIPMLQPGPQQPLQCGAQVFNTMPNYTSVPVLNGSPLFGSPTAIVSPSPAPFVPPLEQRSVFFAGVTPVVTSETLVALFGQFGRVLDLNLFKPWAGSKTSKGCGLVVFEDHAQAAAALQALHGRFQWPGARGPMVVEWMDSNKQHKKARAQPLMQPLLQHQLMAMQSRMTANLVPAQMCMVSTNACGAPQPVSIMF